MVPHAPGREGSPQQPLEQGQTGQDPQAPIPGLHHVQMLGGHKHDHRHSQGTELGGVGPHRGEGQTALAEHPMGRLLLDQQDGGASCRLQRLAQGRVHELQIASAVVGGNRVVNGAAVGEQLRHAGGGRHR